MTGLTRREIVAGTAALVAAANCLRPIPSFAAAPKVRRDVNQLQPDDPIITAYQRAVAAMQRLSIDDPQNPLGWRRQANIHKEHCPHANWFFLPWHRAYLTNFEDICRNMSGDDNFVLPYWDWTKNPQIPSVFWGAGNPLDHPRSATSQSVIAEEFVGANVIARIMRSPDYESFGSHRSTRPKGGQGGGYGQLEFTPHNNAHGFVGGDMQTFMSPLDPIFWLHHCNVDRIWASWNAIGNLNPTDAGLADFVLEANFVDRNGQPLDTRIAGTYATDPLGYIYDRLEPRPDPGVVLPVPQGMVLVPTASFGQVL